MSEKLETRFSRIFKSKVCVIVNKKGTKIS